MNFPTDEELDAIERTPTEAGHGRPGEEYVHGKTVQRLIAAARDRNRLERGYLSDDSCPRCAPLAAENKRLTEQCLALDSSNRAFQEDRRLTGELADAHRRLTTELAEARARLIPEEERRKLEGDVLTAESASAELCDQLERVQRDLGKARADLFARGALIASLTKERDECAARLTQEVIDFDRTARELGAILDAWKRYQRNDLSREEFEGVIAERAAHSAVNISSAEIKRVLTQERRALAKAMLLRAREVYMRDDVLTWDESVRVVAGEVDSGAFDGKD